MDGKPVLARQNVGRYTYDEVLELMDDVRSGSPNEWGDGQKARGEEMLLQGGPLVRIGQGDLQVTLAPAMMGQVRQITYGGVDCLHVATVDDGYDTYPLAGSSHVRHEKPAFFMQTDGTPTATSAELAGVVGLGLWGNGTTPVDQVVDETYTVADDGNGTPHLDVLGVITPEPDADHDWHVVSVETVYAVSDNESDHTVTTDVTNGVVTVRLPGQAWVIRDEYRNVSVTNITTAYDQSRQSLTVTVDLAKVYTIPSAGTSATYLDRVLSIVED